MQKWKDFEGLCLIGNRHTANQKSRMSVLKMEWST